jgi:superfamily II DNA or RNA helicase
VLDGADPVNENVDQRGSSENIGLVVGDIVALRADHSRAGPIIAELEPIGGRRRFRVYHSATQIRDYFEDQIEPAPVELPRDEWTDRIIDQRFVGHSEFRARLTATRLNNPQVDHIYALRAARIQYIPFQFKPLLRLLHADQPRLLIADDVGVGKTIEAGLILKELSTRQQLDRVIVLCPKALTTKWRAEMRRFDENFRVLSADSLRYCLDEADLEGEWPQEYARSIVHYELFRREPYLVGGDDKRRRHHRGLLELDPAASFDLVIADEAHHLRTPGTGSHRLIEHLCLTAEAVLMLSATPVQVDADNLFTLLHLLRPDLFPDKSVFREVVAPNRHITEAVRLLRFGSSLRDDWVTGAASALSRAGETAWGRAALQSDPRFQAVAARLNSGTVDDQSRVTSIHDLEELHSLAHVMNRTRRRDIGRFTVRDPQTVTVEFTPHQQRLYDALLDFRREALLQRYDPQVVRLILDTLERQAASCINAMGATIEAILEQGGVITSVTDDPEADPDTDLPLASLPTALLERASDLLSAAAALPDDDPKFDRLQAIVDDRTGASVGPGKVLVFSFFLNTIGYLASRLRDAGGRVGVVTGRVPDEEREELRERFRLGRDDPDALDVLLSSEVGCEGLDYEFCDTLVNYDIPWNPMRIEQRIGRIDRFGQQSDKVTIANFITPGTVEERVFFRCFDRLGVFRDTVGDLEEVLGGVVQDLNRIALDPSLTDEQAEQLARQAADNAIRLADQQRRLDEESGELLGLDDAFTEEVDDVVEGGRFVAEADLRVLIESFLRSKTVDGRLVHKDGPVDTLQLSDPGRRELVSRISAQPRSAQTTVSFLRAIEHSSEIDVTFDQAAALEHRELEFVTPVHPLAREAARHWTADNDLPIGRISLRAPDVPPGMYIVSCEIWETIAARPDLRLVCLAAALPGGVFAPELSRHFVALLPTARDAKGTSRVPEADIRNAMNRLDRYSDERRRQSLHNLEATNEVLLNRRLASLNSFHESRRGRVAAELRDASEPRIARMKTSELARIDADYERRRAALERARRVEVLAERVAMALVEVADGR